MYLYLRLLTIGITLEIANYIDSSQRLGDY